MSQSQFFNLDAEKTALGFVMATTENFSLGMNFLRPELLEDTRHLRIWEAARFYYSQFGGVLDRVGLETLLKQNGALAEKQVMYLALLDEIKSRVVTEPQFKVALETLEDLRFRRGLYDMVNSAASHLDRPNVDRQKVCNDIVSSILSIQSGNNPSIREMSFKMGREERIKAYMDRKEHPEKYKGVPYGIKKLDELTGGLMPGELGILFGRPGSGKCVTGDTIIPTSLGLVPIKLLSDFRISGKFGPTNRRHWVLSKDGCAKVEAFYCGEKQLVWELKTYSGYELRASAEHKIWVLGSDGQYKFIPMSELRVGDWACINRAGGVWPSRDAELPVSKVRTGRQRALRLPRVLNGDIARWLGYVIAEGYLGTDANLSNNDGVVLQDVQNILKEHFSYGVRIRGRGIKKIIGFQASIMRSWLGDLGMMGQLSKDKGVPIPVMRSTKECARQFLRGYFEGDGTVGMNRLEVCSASKMLMDQIQLLLLNFGIASIKRSMWKCATNGSRIKREYWRLSIRTQDAVLYAERIGFVPNGLKEKAWVRRRDNFYSSINKNGHFSDVIPNLGAHLRALSCAISDKTGGNSPGQKRPGTGFAGLVGRKVGSSFYKRNWTRPRLKKFLQRVSLFSDISEYKELQELSTSPYFYDRVESVQDTGVEEQLFDISVEGSHSYVANGIVTHNSSLLFNISYGAALLNYNTLYVTIEMPIDQVGRRVDARDLQISAKGLRSSTLSSADENKYFSSVKKWEHMPGDIFFIDMPEGCSVAQLLPILRRYKMRMKVDLLCIDYLNLMSPTKWSSSKVERTGDVATELKKLARLESIPILTPARATRDAAKLEDGDIGTEHLSWSDSLGYDADHIVYLKKGKSINALQAEVEAVVIKSKESSNDALHLGVDWDRGFMGDMDTLLKSLITDIAL